MIHMLPGGCHVDITQTKPNQKDNMKTKMTKLVAALTLAATSMAAKADGISEALTAADGYETAVGAGVAAIIGVSLVFVGIKLGKRVLGKF